MYVALEYYQQKFSLLPHYFSVSLKHSSMVSEQYELGFELFLHNRDNYTLWSKAMELALLGKNNVGFINGTVKNTQFTGDLTRLWDRFNAIVISWILCNVSKDLHSGVFYCSDSHLIREDLKERFNKLHKEIFTLVQGVSSVSLYYSRLKDSWDEYDCIMPPPACTYSRSKEFFEQSQHKRMLQFLMGRNDNYSQARR
uniref:Retrotransposon Copia-like N-terminal domain-containing protein n=1 Tax=Solanum lycopersicum TaxID=4081 RepID=A0A3Q7FJV6_SOLLC